MLREILKLETSKACQDTDVKTKIITGNANLLTYFFQILIILWEELIFHPPWKLKRKTCI